VVTHLPFATPTNRPKKVPMSEGNPLALVVDDEVQIRRILRAGLELDGFAVEEAENGGDALRWATLRSPDLVILDLGLPDLDGSEVLERLRGWSTVPVIALSVRSNEGEKVRLLNKGADDYIVKPFGMAELLARARAAMRRYARASTEEPVIKLGPLAVDLAAHNHRRCPRVPHAEGISDAPVAGSARGQRGDAPVPAQGNLGRASPQRHALSAHLHA
jgi:CheY-like chemotaxis protein